MNLDTKKAEIKAAMNTLLTERQCLAEQGQQLQKRDAEIVNDLVERRGQIRLIDELIAAETEAN